MSNVGIVAPRGSLNLVRLPRWPGQPSTLEVVRHGLPKRGLPAGVAAWRMRNLPNLWRGLWRVKLAAIASKITHCPAAYGVLYLDILHADGTRTPLGLASMRVVTDTGVQFLVDALQNLVEPELMKFHGFGTGTTAEAASQTALVTEETTQYATDNTRPTGSQTEGAANAYRTVATYSPDSGTNPRPITEHGLFSQAATGGGVMLDRSVFSAVNLVPAADSLQATYDFTINSGG
jgi:hypothetical protein